MALGDSRDSSSSAGAASCPRCPPVIPEHGARTGGSPALFERSLVTVPREHLGEAPRSPAALAAGLLEVARAGAAVVAEPRVPQDVRAEVRHPRAELEAPEELLQPPAAEWAA